MSGNIYVYGTLGDVKQLLVNAIKEQVQILLPISYYKSGEGCYGVHMHDPTSDPDLDEVMDKISTMIDMYVDMINKKGVKPKCQ